MFYDTKRHCALTRRLETQPHMSYTWYKNDIANILGQVQFVPNSGLSCRLPHTKHCFWRPQKKMDNVQRTWFGHFGSKYLKYTANSSSEWVVRLITQKVWQRRPFNDAQYRVYIAHQRLHVLGILWRSWDASSTIYLYVWANSALVMRYFNILSPTHHGWNIADNTWKSILKEGVK